MKGDKTITKDNKPRGAEQDSTRVNDKIKSPKVRLIDENGEMVGVVSTREAIDMAKEAGLDLVEVSPNAEPPVCKILDYGKYKYQLQKKQAEARKKQKIVTLKELKIRPGIEENDYQVKLRSARKFIEEEDKVKITMRFKGREMAHQDLGMKLFERIKEDLSDITKVDFGPKMEGRQAVMIVSPK